MLQVGIAAQLFQAGRDARKLLGQFLGRHAILARGFHDGADALLLLAQPLGVQVQALLVMAQRIDRLLQFVLRALQHGERILQAGIERPGRRAHGW